MSINTFLPAEWEIQDGILLAWPHIDSDWHPLFPEIQNDFLALASTILQYESLIVICRNKNHRDEIASLLAATNPNYPAFFAALEYNDTWCRDFGPVTVVKNGQPKLLDFVFNGWGNRYDASLDNLITQKLDQQKLFATPSIKIDMILEGGSIESNGVGTLLTTESCLLNNNRNQLSKLEIEALLKKHLAAEQLLWLKYGSLAGDDTDSHIDNLARFVTQDTIAYLCCDDPNDSHYPVLKRMQRELTEFIQSNGEPYKLIPLPLPGPCFSKIDQRRLPASYLNFLVINDAVLIPSFGCESDSEAQQTLQRCFPERKIVAISSRNFIEQNGGIHCLTMQLPKGTLKN